MRAVIQRVKSAKVRIDNQLTASIDAGLLVFLGIADDDTLADANYICDKIVNLRILDDDDGVPNRSVLDKKASLLLVSQFTLYGDARKGRRPSYIKAAKPERAIPLYEACKQLLDDKVLIQCGTFQADMQVELINDGPFTILLDSRKEF